VFPGMDLDLSLLLKGGGVHHAVGSVIVKAENNAIYILEGSISFKRSIFLHCHHSSDPRSTRDN